MKISAYSFARSSATSKQTNENGHCALAPPPFPSKLASRPHTLRKLRVRGREVTKWRRGKGTNKSSKVTDVMGWLTVNPVTKSQWFEMRGGNSHESATNCS